MRWSRVISPNSDPVNSDTSTVLEFQPKQFDFGTPQAALNYLDFKKLGSDFVLNDVFRKTTGVEKIEKNSEEKRIEESVLHRVAEIQKIAYDEGAKLGFQEGKAEAIKSKTAELETELLEMKSIIESLKKIKIELVQENEKHLITLVYNLAKKIALDQIEERPQVVMNIITQAIEQAQLEEDISVAVSPGQFKTIENLVKNHSENVEIFKDIKITSADSIRPGGCVIETNYGIIDAQIEERTEKLWTELSALMPKKASANSIND